MFYLLKNLEHKVWLHPSNMKDLYNEEGKTSLDEIWKRLVAYKAYLDLEGDFDPDLGYIIQVQKLTSISQGIIQAQSGLIEHSVIYSAIVQMPIEGEVIEAVIIKIAPSYIVFNFLGYIYGIVRQEYFSPNDDYLYKEIELEKDEKDKPKKKEADPKKVEKPKKLQWFFSQADPERNLKIGTVIRVRIIKRAYGNTGFWLQGSMKNKHLGINPEIKELVQLSRKKNKSEQESNFMSFEITDFDKTFILHSAD